MDTESTAAINDAFESSFVLVETPEDGEQEYVRYTVTLLAGLYGASVMAAPSQNAEEVGCAKPGKLVSARGTQVNEEGKWLSIAPSSMGELCYDKPPPEAWVLAETPRAGKSFLVSLESDELRGTAMQSDTDATASELDEWEALEKEAEERVSLSLLLEEHLEQQYATIQAQNKLSRQLWTSLVDMARNYVQVTNLKHWAKAVRCQKHSHTARLVDELQRQLETAMGTAAAAKQQAQEHLLLKQKEQEQAGDELERLRTECEHLRVECAQLRDDLTREQHQAH